jgi:hypothetical protein
VIHLQQVLASLLSLSHSFTLQGAGSWWEEAKKYYPLLLVQALMTTAHVSMAAERLVALGKDVDLT